ITQEILKLLAADDPAPVLDLMKDRAIMPELLKEFDGGKMRNLSSRRPLTRLALMASSLAQLVMSNEQRRQIEILHHAADTFFDADEKAVKRLVYEHGNETACEIYALWCARNDRKPQGA